jgi:predicted glycoside hydrolase/deacetylase ChbG (UPF0249 family)
MPRLAPSGTFPNFSEVLRRSFLGQLPADEIADEINRQLDAVEAALGRPPDFVDGHQHVHVLPGIRAPLLEALAQRGLSGRIWLRDPSDQVASIIRRRVALRKAITVQALASGFGKAARAAGFGVNQGFSGFSPFDPERDAAADFASFFEALGPHPVIMCHPGHVDSELRSLDPVVETRAQEYAYLASDRFLELLDSRAIALVPRPG